MALAEPSSLQDPSADASVSGADMFWYALPASGVTFLYTLVAVMYLKFTTDVLLVSSAAVGTILLVSKVWDALSDPIAGFLSDRTSSRMGRRKSWLFGASVPFAISAVMLWMPPDGLSPGQMTAWIAVAVFAFFTAYTGLEVPHLALGAELTQQPTVRNRVFGVRTLLKTIGMFATFGLGVTLLDSENARSHAAPLAIAVSAFTMIALWGMVWKCPKERSDYSGRGAQNPFHAIRDVWRNRLARNVLIVYFIEAAGVGGIGVLVPFVVEYVMEMPGQSAPFLVVYALAQFIGIPIWVKLGDHFEKQHLWMFSMGQSFVGFGLMVFLSAGNWPLMVVSSLLAGSAGACSNTIGVSLKADVIDTDEYETGERKEGSFFAAWSLANKLAGGLMVGVVGIVLAWVGYVPNEAQTPEVRRWMLFLMGGVPMLGYGVGMLLFRAFDLKRAEHTRICAELEARRAAQPRA